MKPQTPTQNPQTPFSRFFLLGGLRGDGWGVGWGGGEYTSKKGGGREGMGKYKPRKGVGGREWLGEGGWVLGTIKWPLCFEMRFEGFLK